MKKLVLIIVISISIWACGGSKTKEGSKATSAKDSVSAELKILNDKIIAEPNNIEAYLKRGNYYVSHKQGEAAYADALLALNIDSTKNIEAYILATDANFIQNKTAKAKEYLEKALVKMPENTSAMLRLGELYFYVQQYQLCFDYCNKALKLNQGLSKAYYLKGMAYKETGDTTDALSNFSTAVEVDNKYYNAYMQLALIYSARKSDVALKYFDNALRINGRSLEAQYGIAKTNQDLERIDVAIKEYKKLLVIYPKHVYSLYNIGALELDYNKNIPNAMDAFTRAISFAPEYAEAYFGRGMCYKAKKDFSNARADFNMCLQLKPNYPLAIDALNEIDKGK